MSSIIDFLYDIWYNIIDHKLVSIIIFIGLIWWTWGSYTYLPEYVPALKKESPIIEDSDEGSSEIIPEDTSTQDTELKEKDTVNEADISQDIPQNTESTASIETKKEEKPSILSRITNIFTGEKKEEKKNETPVKNSVQQSASNIDTTPEKPINIETPNNASDTPTSTTLQPNNTTESSNL